MKVLFILPEFPPIHGGGIATYYSTLVTALRQIAEIEVVVGSAYINSSNFSGEFESYLRPLCRNRFDSWMGKFSQFEPASDLQRHLAAAFAIYDQCDRGDGYDAVELVDWGLPFIPWILNGNQRISIQMHASCGQISYFDPRRGHEIEELLYCLLESVCLSSAEMRTHSRSNQRWWQEELDKHVGYCPPPFEMSGSPMQSVTRTSNYVVVGRIQKWKGPQLLCEELKSLRDRCPQVSWIGRDVANGSVNQSMSKWLENKYPGIWGMRVLPVGQKSPNEVRLAMASARALIVPSIWDVYNLTAVEAMACGTPVIVSTAAGAADLIEHGKNGFLFDPDTSGSLAQAIGNLESMSEQDLEEIGDLGRQTIINELNPKSIAIKQFEHYTSLDKKPANSNYKLSEMLQRKSTLDDFLRGIASKSLVGHLGRRIFKKT